MQLSLIFDGRTDCWVGRAGGVEMPLSLFQSLCHNMRAHYEIMANDLLRAVMEMRGEYSKLKDAEMYVQKSKSAAAEFKALRQRQERQMAAIRQMEIEQSRCESAAENYKQMTNIIAKVENLDPRYVIRG